MVECSEMFFIVSFIVAALSLIFMTVTHVLPIKNEIKCFAFKCAAWTSITHIVFGILYYFLCLCLI